MSYNFKSIADVEVVETPTDSANVLIEEDGVIKKAPKTVVGSSGAEFDGIILVQDYGDSDGNYAYSDITIEAGSYADILAKLQAHEIVKVALHGVNFTYGCNVAFCVESVSVSECTLVDPAEDGTYPLRMIYLAGDDYRWSLYWHSDDTVSYYNSQTAAVSLLSEINHAPGRN